jgi:hypothetical protein
MTDQILIYHITHLDNLPSILRYKGLWCDIERIKKGWLSVGIAHEGLKRRRLEFPVNISACGTLGNYVPFYFCNRSPMLNSIHTGYVENYSGTQEDIIYLVSNVSCVTSQRKRLWCFTDGHAVEEMTNFYDSLDQLSNIDWKTIGAWSWKNITSDPDRKRRKQAEFLVYESFPLPWIQKIGVYSNVQKEKVETLLHHNSLPVSIEKKWYY